MSVNEVHSISRFPDIDKVISQKSPSVPEDTINAPFDYLQSLSSNNNKIRSKFLAGFNERFFQISDGWVIAEIGAIIESLHGASLLIDDIEDDSTFRRGQPCAHINYGVPATINSGNLMYFVAIQRAFSSLPTYHSSIISSDESALASFKIELSNIFIDEMVNLHIGQGFDIYWRDNLVEVMRKGLPTIEEYLQVVMHKTGGLFRLAVRMLSLVSGAAAADSPATKEVINLANVLGIIYQVRDDYLNLVDERYAEMKGFSGEDLIEGKLSLPILYALLHSKDDSKLRQVYADLKTPSERRANLERLEEARSWIADSGALEFSYLLLQEYVQKARRLICSADGESSQILSGLLTKLSQVDKA